MTCPYSLQLLLWQATVLLCTGETKVLQSMLQSMKPAMLQYLFGTNWPDPQVMLQSLP